MQLKSIDPINTYLKIKDFETIKSITALYHLNQSGIQESMPIITSSKYYESHFIDKSGYIYVIYTMFDFSNLYNLVLQGKYSEINGEDRSLLTAHNNPLIEYGLNPYKYIEEFAEAFRWPKDQITKNGELMSPPDLDCETLNVPDSIMNELIESYELI